MWYTLTDSIILCDTQGICNSWSSESFSIAPLCSVPCRTGSSSAHVVHLPLPAARQGCTGLINCFCSCFNCLKSCEMCLLSQRSWGWPRLHHFGSFILERGVAQPVCLSGHFTYFTSGRRPRCRNEWRCRGSFPRVPPPVSPSALPSSHTAIYWHDSLCLFSVAFINLLYLLLSALILSLPFCIDLFLFQVVSPSVYFLHFVLYSLLLPFPSLCYKQSFLQLQITCLCFRSPFLVCDGSLRSHQVPPSLRGGTENFPVLLLPSAARVGNMGAVTHLLSCPMMCRRIIYPFYWAHNRAEEREKQTASFFLTWNSLISF